jgi:hypothetical protein
MDAEHADGSVPLAVPASAGLQRIARGLMRARALETRVIETAAKLNKARGRRPGAAPAHRQPRAVPAAARPAEAPDAPIELPTEEEIAAWVRRRPIGAVLADICRDLGITCDHPLWRELQHAITAESGNYVRLVMDIVHRAARRVAEAWFPAAPVTSIPLPSREEVRGRHAVNTLVYTAAD